MVEARPSRGGVTSARGNMRGGATASTRGTAASTRGTAASTRGAAAAATRGVPAASTARGGAKIVGAQRDDYECPVCLELCAQPVLTPCKHFMCFQCHKRVVEAGMTCPMCRAHFDKLFIPQIDIELQQEIAAAMGEQFEERKAELEGVGEWLGNKRLVKFSFGNTHEEVEKPRQARSNPKLKNTHRWCMFMSLSNDVEQTTKFIKSVTYHLHHTFKPSKIKVSEAPFLLSRTGWGTFDIQMDVEFQPSSGLGVKKVTHELEFDGTGNTQSFLLEVNNDDNDANMAAALAAQMDKLNMQSSER